MDQFAPRPWRIEHTGNNTTTLVDANGVMIEMEACWEDFARPDQWPLIVKAVNNFEELIAIVRCYWTSRSEVRWLAEEPVIHARIKAVLANIGHPEGISS